MVYMPHYVEVFCLVTEMYSAREQNEIQSFTAKRVEINDTLLNEAS